ncbi:unnamed protein product [Pylaiella littoralis]
MGFWRWKAAHHRRDAPSARVSNPPKARYFVSFDLKFFGFRVGWILLSTAVTVGSWRFISCDFFHVFCHNFCCAGHLCLKVVLVKFVLVSVGSQLLCHRDILPHISLLFLHVLRACGTPVLWIDITSQR